MPIKAGIYPRQLFHQELPKRVCFSLEEHMQLEPNGWSDDPYEAEGGGPVPEEQESTVAAVSDEPQAMEAEAATGRACSVCGKTGHNARTCTNK